MKKILLLLVAVLGLQGYATAQETRFGAKAGANFANLTGDVSNNSMLTALHLGVMVEIGLSDKFAFQPELLYSAQGTKIKISQTIAGVTVNVDSKTELGYLNLPLMAKYYASENFSLELGPQVGFLMSAKSNGTDIKDSTKSIDFGLNLGAGYKMDNGLNFGARYGLGLANIADDDDSSVKNAVISVSVGYFF